MPNPQDDQVATPDKQQIDPKELSGQQEPPKKEKPLEHSVENMKRDELESERRRLQALQANTEQEAQNIASEALAVILAMGWTFGARINEQGQPEFIVAPLPLEMWQDINREILRNKLMGK